MKVGDLVYVVEGLGVQEYRVYDIDHKGEPWIRAGGLGMRANGYLNYTYVSLDGAVQAAKAERERRIKRLAREITNLALNPSVKVKLLKPTKQHSK